jgi:hypothetical protein
MCPGPMAYAAFPKLALDQGQRPQAIPNVLNRVSWAGGWQSEPRGSKSSSAFLPSHSCPPRGSIRPFATGWQRCLRLLKRHTQYTSFSVGRPQARATRRGVPKARRLPAAVNRHKGYLAYICALLRDPGGWASIIWQGSAVAASSMWSEPTALRAPLHGAPPFLQSCPTDLPKGTKH